MPLYQRIVCQFVLRIPLGAWTLALATIAIITATSAQERLERIQETLGIEFATEVTHVRLFFYVEERV